MKEDVLGGYYVVLGSQAQALTEDFRGQISQNKLSPVLFLYNNWGSGVLFRVFTAE